MERLSLNKTWRLCLQMWKWIAGQKLKDNPHSVDYLKGVWLKEHGGGFDIYNDCFFCEYDAQHEDNDDDGVCLNCPAVLVSSRFRCDRKTYDYDKKPIAFYKKLLELNKKRLSKKESSRQGI